MLPLHWAKICFSRYPQKNGTLDWRNTVTPSCTRYTIHTIIAMNTTIETIGRILSINTSNIAFYVDWCSIAITPDGVIVLILFLFCSCLWIISVEPHQPLMHIIEWLTVYWFCDNNTILVCSIQSKCILGSAFLKKIEWCRENSSAE